MNDEQLKTFITVKDCGSFNAGEKELYISKQAMIKQINTLEDELGFRLFIRKHNGVSLTRQGEVFYKGAKDLLKKKEELLANCYALENQPVIRIGNNEHQTLLDPVNIAFSKKYPHLHLKRIVNPNHSGEWRVDNNIQDVAETFHINIENYRNAEYFPLILREYKAVMRKNHPLSHCDVLSLDKISHYPVTVFPLMMTEDHLNKIRKHFRNNINNLNESQDVDHQIELVYQCMNSNEILISANPFIDSIENIAKIPLTEHFTIEYGLICHKPVTDAVRKYIQVAEGVYKDKAS